MIVDRILLSLCQRFSDWLQDWTSWTAFSCAWACLYLLVILQVSNAVFAVSAYRYLNILAAAYTFVVFSPIIRNLERLSGKSGVINPISDHWAGAALRLFFVAILIISILGLVFDPCWSNIRWLADRVLNALWIYFVSCNKKPPGKSRLKKLVEKLDEMLSPCPLPEGC